MLADMHPPAPIAVDVAAAIELVRRAPTDHEQPDARRVFGGFRLIAQSPGGTGTNDRGNSGPGRTGVPKDPPAPGASPGAGGTPDPNQAAPDAPKKKKRPRQPKGGDAGAGGTSG